jgi:hypothetical protein
MPALHEALRVVRCALCAHGDKSCFSMSRALLLATVLLLVSSSAEARIGLVTVPRRDAVQLTIYNSADITLVRERRALTLAKGVNRLEFSWSGTLIDPTSVLFEARTHADKVDVIDISFPAQAPNALVWAVQSEVAGEVVVEISYFTSGISWEADYEAVVNAAGNDMTLSSFVKVSNRSGEEYQGSQVRLVVGKINLVEKIADLANRGGRPIPPRAQAVARSAMVRPASPPMVAGAGALFASEASAPPEIIREGLSEYFLYTVSGEHEVPDRWSVRWPNFAQIGVPVENFYRYEEGRYNEPRRFVKLKNDKDHKLGNEPLPDGRIIVFQTRPDGSRALLGRTISKYIPIGEEWEIDLGADPDVRVKPTMMDWAVESVEFNSTGNPSGWEIVESWKLEVLNSRANPITIEIDRKFAGDFTLKGVPSREMYTFDTARFRRELAPRTKTEIAYEVTTRKGTRTRR